MDTHLDWFKTFRTSSQFSELSKAPIAYFCAEFAISEYLQIYAGGLGILAADVLREAQDQQIPMVAVGIFYRQGYLHHEIHEGHVVTHQRMHKSAAEAGLAQVLHSDGTPLLVAVPIEDRVIHVNVWKVELGSVNLFLLDSQVEQNSEEDRTITDRLYVHDRRLRCLQEIILGVGGYRALEAMNISPSVFHLNEGHSAFLALALALDIMKDSKITFTEALAKAKERLVFTNHTLVAGGNENFQLSLVTSCLKALAQEMDVDVKTLTALGQVPGEEVLSMTTLAFTVSREASAVSEYHEHRAQRVWPENPMIAITNGIHLRRWDQVHSEDDLWQAHQRNKQALLQTIKRKTGEVWDPNTLLVGWGRRVVEYKRPLALFHDLARFKRLATRIDMPIRVVMSGKAHEGDLEGAGYLRQLEELIEGELKGLVTYLSNYSVHIASHMVAGCDVWLNTPRVGYEACGTSGMKAALNGTLPMSTADGWVEEIDLFGIGWKLSDMYVTESCLDELEYNIAPLFYAKDHTSWLTMMKQARELIQNDYSATRMLRDYIEKLYFPTI